jgi:hypothetical protein
MQVISVFGPDGSRLYQTAITVPNQKYISLLNGAADIDGTVAVVFRSPGGFAVLDRSGHPVHTVLTAPYEPTQICFAPDHSIWLEGHEGIGDHEYMVFRKYSSDGHELGRFVSSSKFAAQTPAPHSGHAMRASANGIVALVLEDQPHGPHLMHWLQLDFEGNVVGQPGQHRYFYPWALTPQGSIYAKEGNKFVCLDNLSGNWRESSLPRPGVLVGADENSLIFMLADRRTFKWVALER